MAYVVSSPPLPGSSSPLSMLSSLDYARSLVEDYAKKELPSDRTSNTLFAFLDHLLPDGKEVIAEDIIDSSDLQALANHYFTAVLLPIRASGGKTPTAQRTNDLVDVDNIAVEITTQKRNQAKLKDQCLARDNNRCILTGIYDSEMAVQLLSDAQQQDVPTGTTEAAHIIPFSLASFTEAERHTKAIAWEAIYHAFPSVRDFTTDDINDPRNVLTLLNGLHDAFGKFQFSLEPTETANCYCIKKYRKFPTYLSAHLPLNGIIAFTAHDGRYPLPDGKLFSLHASVAAILQASGMSEVIERILRDRDETPCLATDGSTPIAILLMAC